MKVTRIASHAAPAILLALSSLTAPLTAAEANNLLAALKQGGNVIVVATAKYDWSSRAEFRNEPTDCSNRTVLAETGKKQARLIGDGFEKHKIPIEKVLTSEFCRCVETAQIAFGRAELSDKLNTVRGITGDERRRRMESLRRMVSKPPRAGTNVVLISHRSNINKALLNTSPIWGEASVYRPDGSGGTELIGRVRVEQWATLGATGN